MISGPKRIDVLHSSRRLPETVTCVRSLGWAVTVNAHRTAIRSIQFHLIGNGNFQKLIGDFEPREQSLGKK